jgi:hypothetical protein
MIPSAEIRSLAALSIALRAPSRIARIDVPVTF